MLEEANLKSRVHFTTAVIDTTYRCNDNCVFCFNQKLINKAPELSFLEMKKKYQAATKKWKIHQIILSGGEPTLYPEFWKMMDFFYNKNKALVSLNTNSLRFNDEDFSSEMISFLKKARNRKRAFSLSLSSVNNFPAKTVKEKLKLNGVANALKVAAASQTELMAVIIITKTNYKILPQLVNFLGQHAKSRVKLQMRGLYLNNSMTAEQKSKVVPKDFVKIHTFIEKSILTALSYSNLNIQLFNIPLCYFRNFGKLPDLLARIKPLSNEQRIKIKQGKPVKGRLFHKETWDRPECSGCALEFKCAKIQTEFLQKYNYPPLIPFRYSQLKSVHLVPTYGCNLACSYCYASKFKGKFPQMSWQKFQKILNQLITNNIGRIVFIGGEPTTWKFLNKAVEITKSLGMETVVLTNAVLRIEKLPHAITVNGNNIADVKLRERIIANLKFYRERGVRVGLRFNLDLKTTPALMKQYAAWAKDYADEVSISPIVPYKLNKQLGKTLYDFAKLIEKNKQKVTFSRALPICIFTSLQLNYLHEKCGLYSVCSPANSSLTINPDATIFPCVDLKIPQKPKQDLNENCVMYDVAITKLKNTPTFAACKTCKHFRVACQGGCLSMKCYA